MNPESTHPGVKLDVKIQQIIQYLKNSCSKDGTGQCFVVVVVVVVVPFRLWKAA